MLFIFRTFLKQFFFSFTMVIKRCGDLCGESAGESPAFWYQSASSMSNRELALTSEKVPFGTKSMTLRT